ncbi:MAG: hypothetical protein K8L99_36085 [Anaerolineae bacterium]|nr:hypothetical protein [Anaerolineae bacterium]
MIRILIGVFIILHGLVHLLYFGLSRKLFELDTPLVGWPERSWLFSSFLGESATRSFASALYMLATALFVISGAGILLRTNWWTPVLVSATIFASAITIFFWDGKLLRLPDKGFIGILINIVILVGLFLIERYSIAF